MLPYPIHSINFLGFQIPLFTFFVGAAIAIGTVIMDRELDRLGFSGMESVKIIFVILVSGLYSSHFVALFVYNLDRLGEAGLMDYLDPFNGMSSTGGFLGSAAGFFLIRRKLGNRAWKVADSVILSLVVGWGIARLGCTFAFDHPGSLTHFFLAFDHPDGGPRHNLGFYEMLFAFFVLVPAAWFMKNNAPPPGSQVAVACLLYAPVRYVLDFLRAADIPHPDTRYLGLTFAQYACIFIFLAGLWLFNHIGTREFFFRKTKP